MASPALKLALAGLTSVGLGFAALLASPPGPCTLGIGILFAAPAGLVGVSLILIATVVAVVHAIKRMRHRRLWLRLQRLANPSEETAYGPYRETTPPVLDEPVQTTPDPRTALVVCSIIFGALGLLFSQTDMVIAIPIVLLGLGGSLAALALQQF
jgi:hypothetical protein